MARGAPTIREPDNNDEILRRLEQTLVQPPPFGQNGRQNANAFYNDDSVRDVYNDIIEIDPYVYNRIQLQDDIFFNQFPTPNSFLLAVNRSYSRYNNPPIITLDDKSKIIGFYISRGRYQQTGGNRKRKSKKSKKSKRKSKS